jgi:hypothetical protein
MVTKQCLVEFKIGGYRDEILCDVIPWMYVLFCWGDHGSMIGIPFMMEEKILILWRKMVGHTCCCQ